MKVGKLSIQVFDKGTQRIAEIFAETGIFSTSLKDKKRKIRVRYDRVDYPTRKEIMEFLKKQGFQQVGNTTSWILGSSSTKNIA